MMPDGVVKLKKQETVEMKTNIYNSITKVTIFILVHNGYVTRMLFSLKKKKQIRGKIVHIDHDNEFFAWCRNDNMLSNWL